MSDYGVYKSLLTARVTDSNEGTLAANAGNVVAQTQSRAYRHAIANLSANVAESPVLTVPYKAQFKSANLGASANAVANATDYSLVTVSKRTGNGAAVTVATANLSNVAVTKFVPIALTVTSNLANATLAAGDVVTVTVGLTGNGTANNAIGSLDFLLEDIG